MKARLNETSNLIEKLDLQENFENKYKNENLYNKILSTLDEKTIRYKNYITN